MVALYLFITINCLKSSFSFLLILMDVANHVIVDRLHFNNVSRFVPFGGQALIFRRSRLKLALLQTNHRHLYYLEHLAPATSNQIILISAAIDYFTHQNSNLSDLSSIIQKRISLWLFDNVASDDLQKCSWISARNLMI